MENSEHFIETVRFEFLRTKQLAEKAIVQLNDEEFRKQFSPDSNSVQIIIQHMSGNMLSRWTDFLTSDGEKEWRKRDAEFESQEISRDEIMKLWEKGWNVLFAAIDQVKPGNLLQDVFIRKEALTVTQALLRQLSHYSYHVGQIVHVAKDLKGENWKTLSIAKNKSGEYKAGNYKGEWK